MTSVPTHDELVHHARSLVRPLILARPDWDAGTVGCALVDEAGQVHEGVCIDLSCGLGFCAEASAIANMIKAGQTRILTIVAAASDRLLAPCGRCREMLAQVDHRNLDCDVILEGPRVVKLRELLPEPWFEEGGDSLERTGPQP